MPWGKTEHEVRGSGRTWVCTGNMKEGHEVFRRRNHVCKEVKEGRGNSLSWGKETHTEVKVSTIQRDRKETSVAGAEGTKDEDMKQGQRGTRGHPL